MDLGTALGIVGTLAGIAIGWLISRHYYRQSLEDSRKEAETLARQNTLASMASAQSAISDLEEAGAIERDPSKSFRIQWFKYGEGEAEPGSPFPPGIFIVKRGHRPVEHTDSWAQVNKWVDEWMEEDKGDDGGS